MLKWHKFDIKSKDSKLLVIDKSKYSANYRY